MTPLDQLDLPLLPLDDPAVGINPWPRFAEARQKHPWLAKCSHGYIVHDYYAIKEMLVMDDYLHNAHEEFVAMLGATGTPWGRMVEEEIANRSGPVHKRLRDVLAPTFTPRKANQHRALMRNVVSKLLDEWIPRKEFNFEDFASYFPISVMCSIIGAPTAAIPDLRWSMEMLVSGMNLNRDLVPSLQKAVATLDAFIEKLVAERRAGQRLHEFPDLLDDLLAAQDSGGITARELADLLIVLFAAGYDTSKNVLTLMMWTMISHPDHYERCSTDFEFCGRAVEESLRYHNPATMSRLTSQDLGYRDVLFPKGTRIFFPISVANRDPRVAKDADTFDPDRTQDNRHLAFGRGMHMCLGLHIARAQLEEGWHLITQRIRKPRIAGPVGWRPFLSVWGVRGLPIAFDTEGVSNAA